MKVITLQGRAKTGKTTTLKKVVRELRANYGEPFCIAECIIVAWVSTISILGWFIA